MISRNVRDAGRAPLLLLALVFAAGLVLSACGDDTPPDMLPLEPQSVAVNDTLRILLSVENPSGDALDFDIEHPELPSFDEATYLAGSATGAEFRWTPLASHVGTHEITFHVSSSSGKDSESVLVTVSPSASAAPVFLRPGFGGTFDLAKDPCVAFDVEVRDDDSLDVDIRPRKPLPAKASLQEVAGNKKRARFEWCPDEEQVQRSLRWNIALEADDHQHSPPQPHDYLIVFRTPEKGNCPGTPPTVTVVSPADGASITGVGGYPVQIVVSDDTAVRDAPILYYGTARPGDTPSIAEFEGQRVFEATGTKDQWTAVVPPLDLLEGEEQTVFYMVSVTDNDDENGTACDHHTESPVHNLVARGASPDQKADDCDACTASTQCASGVCAAESGGRCLPLCAGGACTTGSCSSVATVDGQSAEACGDVATVCLGGGGECTNDSNEPNDSFETPTLFVGTEQRGTVCPGDVDYYWLEGGEEGDIVVSLSGFDAATNDLEIALIDETGEVLGIAGTSAEVEQMAYCLWEGESLGIAVLGYREQDQGDYLVDIVRSAGACCVNDSYEPDSTLENARPAGADGTFDGKLCPLDVDYISFVATEPTLMTAYVTFTGDNTDIDLVLYAADGTFIEGAWTESMEEEELVLALPTAGTYVLRVEPYGEGAVDYVGTVSLGEIGACSSTLQCPLFNVCLDGECVTDACVSAFECPPNHSCEPPGPSISGGYCSLECASDNDCRVAQDEECKWFDNGRYCGPVGTGTAGSSCTFFDNCGSGRVCASWPGGYCARLACASDADCESNTFCALDPLGQGYDMCVRRCGGTEPECRIAEGYVCSTVNTAGGSEQGCVQ